MLPADFGCGTYPMKKSSGENIQAEINSVGPQYFETLRIPLIRGRDFRWTDDKDSQPVAVINQAAARQYWGPTPIQSESGSSSNGVVGRCSESLRRSNITHPGGGSHPYVYVPLLQEYEASFTLMARGRQPAGATVSSMRQAVRELDPDLPTFGPPSLTATLALPMAATRFMNFLLSVFGFLTLTLASLDCTASLPGQLSNEPARSRFVWQWEQDVKTQSC